MKAIKKATSLTERVLHFQKTGAGYEEIVRDLALEIYYYPLRKGWGEEDDAGDFYLYVYPRLVRVLRNYRAGITPFEHYFHAYLYWCLHNYFKRKQQVTSAWQIKPYMSYYIQPDTGLNEFWAESGFSGTVVPAFDTSSVKSRYISPVVKKILKLNAQGYVKNKTGKHRLLILTLRYCSRLNEEELTYLACMAGCSFTRLKEHIHNLKPVIEKKENTLRDLRIKRNQTFYRCCLLEEQVARQPEQERCERVVGKIAKYRQKIAAYSRQINRITPYPSYRKIARELGLPRGTVDTGFRSIKKSLSGIYAERKKRHTKLYDKIQVRLEKTA